MSEAYKCRLLNLRITTLKTMGSMFGLNFFTGLGSFGAFLGIVIEVLVIIRSSTALRRCNRSYDILTDTKNIVKQ